MSGSEKELRLAHERIQDLEALIANQRLPIRQTTSRWRGLVALAFAAALGMMWPLHHIPLAVPKAWPAKLPPGALTLADNAPPVFVKSGDKELAIVRGFWRGHNASPLHVVALDCADWSVVWASDPFPVTAFDRGSVRLDVKNEPAATVLLFLGERYYALTLDHGTNLGEAPAGHVAHGVTEESNAALTAKVEQLNVPGIGPGSRVGGLVQRETELVITANDAIFIVDAATKTLKKRITAF